MAFNTILCLDTSLSMRGYRLEKLQKGCRRFLDTLHSATQDLNLRESVTLIEFGGKGRVLQTRTTNYDEIHKAIDRLSAHGEPRMSDGLVKCRNEMMDLGGVQDLPDGVKLIPRIILVVSDDSHNREKVIKIAESLGSSHRVFSLPYPIPIVCVGFGTIDKEFLKHVADVTNGMYTMLDDVKKLKHIFRKQALLTRFMVKHINKHRGSNGPVHVSEQDLDKFYKEKAETVKYSELHDLFKLQSSMVVFPRRETRIQIPSDVEIYGGYVDDSDQEQEYAHLLSGYRDRITNYLSTTDPLSEDRQETLQDFSASFATMGSQKKSQRCCQCSCNIL